MAELVLNFFLSTIPVYVFFAIGYWLRRRGGIAPKDDGALF